MKHKFFIWDFDVIFGFFVSVTISVGFVHREHLSWRRGPYRNPLWMFTGLLVSVLIQFKENKDLERPFYSLDELLNLRRGPTQLNLIIIV